MSPRLLRRLLAVALLSALACAPQADTAEVDFDVPVSVEKVEVATVEDRIVVTGSLRAGEAVLLRSETSGEFHCGRTEAGGRLREGDAVVAGQLLAEITGEDVRLAARTEATLQRYQYALRDHEQKKSLFEQGLLSEAEFRPVEASLAEAKVEWERSKLTEKRSHLITPISGVILQLARDETGRPLADGQIVSAGREIATIAPIASLVADVDLLGTDLARVRPGQEARLRHHAWDKKTFAGELVRLAPSLDPTTRTLRAEVDVGNPERLLRPGMFVEVTLIAERRPDVAVVPREAVTERGGTKVVFVVEQQKAFRREVTLGLGDDDIVEIRNGVEVGEQVVVRGLETLTDGTNVTVSGS